MKSQYIALFACFCLLCAHTVWSEADDTPSYGDTIIVGSITDASNLIPMLASDSASHDISGLIYNGLVKYEKDLNLVGGSGRKLGVSLHCLTVIHACFRGIKPPLAGITYNFISWYVPTREQRVVRSGLSLRRASQHIKSNELP